MSIPRVLVLLALAVPAVAADPKPAVFELLKIWPVHITLDAKEYAAMQPPAALVNRADDSAFRKEIESYLGLDAFRRFLAVHSVIVHIDSCFVTGHNYCLYFHAGTHRFHFIPWDADRAFANFGIFGTPAQQLDLSLVKPYPANRPADRLMAVPGMTERYQKIAKEVVAAAFDKEEVLKDIEALRAATKDLTGREAKAVAGRKEAAAPPFMGVGPPDLPAFVEKRSASLAAQLDGKTKGTCRRPAGSGSADRRRTFRPGTNWPARSSKPSTRTRTGR